MTVITKTISPCAPDKSACACGECGGLECLCRPRFFAGQLLTEEDLNRMDTYVRTRFRMHNLSLHGTGVVNGLKVLCDPCGQVKVTVGHAISPCGDDIILCEDTAVAICDLIQKCKQGERKKLDCDPPRRIADNGCEDFEEEWVLAVKYDERPTRGVMPLRTGTCSSCGCGGTTCDCSDCECDSCCEGEAPREMPKPRGASLNCEPSVICEGYRFCVYRKPESNTDNYDGFKFFDRDSELVQQLKCCIDLLTATFPSMPDGLNTDQPSAADYRALAKFCCQFRANLLDYFRKHPHTNCELIERLSNLRCPEPEQQDGFGQAFLASFLVLFAIWLDAVKQCICLALLPPAPSPTCEDRIPLATVKVRGRDCKVLSVCNWTTERDMLISWPSVTYWLGSLGIWDYLREALDTICCASFADIFDDVFRDELASVSVESEFVNFEDEAAAEESLSVSGSSEFIIPIGDDGSGEAEKKSRASASPLNFAANVDKAWRGVVRELSLDFGDLNIREFAMANVAAIGHPMSITSVMNGLGPKFRFGQTQRQLSDVEMASIPETVAMEFFGRPVLAGILSLAGQANFAGMQPSADAGIDVYEVKDLRDEIERQRNDIELLKLAMTGKEG